MSPLPTLDEMAVYLRLGHGFAEAFDFVVRDREMENVDAGS
jgi:hypothetical protein